MREEEVDRKGCIEQQVKERERGSANGSEGNNKREGKGSVSESEKSRKVENEERDRKGM